MPFVKFAFRLAVAVPLIVIPLAVLAWLSHLGGLHGKLADDATRDTLRLTRLDRLIYALVPWLGRTGAVASTFVGVGAALVASFVFGTMLAIRTLRKGNGGRVRGFDVSPAARSTDTSRDTD